MCQSQATQLHLRDIHYSSKTDLVYSGSYTRISSNLGQERSKYMRIPLNCLQTLHFHMASDFKSSKCLLEKISTKDYFWAIFYFFPRSRVYVLMTGTCCAAQQVLFNTQKSNAPYVSATIIVTDVKSPSRCNEPGSSPKIESKISQFETEGQQNIDEFYL